MLRHKWFVFLACLEYRVPLWIAICHDWDKFLPDEWFAYARCFYDAEGNKQYVKSPEFAHAWMLHQHRNKHHWQYWLGVTFGAENCGAPLRCTDYMVWDSGQINRVVSRESVVTILAPNPCDFINVDQAMPDVYRREMLADWIGAGRALGKPKTWEWYEANKDNMLIHTETRAWIEAELAKRQHRAGGC
ncbi:MAG: hypothetical protein AMXMBFR16_13030 [Candidatus Uhrbacteria bacterium]